METEKKTQKTWIIVLKFCLAIAFLPIALLFLVRKSDKFQPETKKKLSIGLIVASAVWISLMIISPAINRAKKPAPVQHTVQTEAPATEVTTVPVTEATTVTTAATEATTVTEAETVPEEPEEKGLYAHRAKVKVFKDFKYYYEQIPQGEVYGLTTQDLRDFHNTIPEDATTFSIVFGSKILWINPKILGSDFHYASYGSYFTEDEDYSINFHNCDVDYSGDKFVISTSDADGNEIIIAEYDTLSSEMFQLMNAQKFYPE